LICFVNYILAYNGFFVNSFIEKSLLVSKIYFNKTKACTTVAVHAKKSAIIFLVVRCFPWC